MSCTKPLPHCRPRSHTGATQPILLPGRFTIRCDPYRGVRLVRRPEDGHVACQRARNRRMVTQGHASLGYEPHQRRRRVGGAKGVGNFRAAHPDVYNQWRKQRAYAEEQYTETTPDAEYIARVTDGTWPTTSVRITDEADDGLPCTIEVPVDPVEIDGWDVNSIERRREWLGRQWQGDGSADGGEDEGRDSQQAADESLPMRPIWEAARFELPDDAVCHAGGWHLSAGDRDPAEAWAERLDRRAAKVHCIEAALRLRTRRARLRTLDRLLDAFSVDGDAGFAALLVEWVCDQVPGYQLHCEAKLQRIHQRGRRPRPSPSPCPYPYSYPLPLPDQQEPEEEEQRWAAA